MRLTLRSPAAITVVAAGLVYLGVVLFPGPQWWNASVLAWDWLGGSSLLTVPLVAAGTAWWAQTVSRLRAQGQWRGISGRHLAVVTIGRLLALLVALHLVALAALLALGRARGLDVGLDGAPLVLGQLAALAFAVSLGLAVGAVTQHRLAAPAVALAIFLTPVVLYGRVPRSLFLLGGATGLPAGYQPNLGYVAAQAAWALGLALALAVVGLAAQLRPLSRAWLVGTAGCAALGLLLAAWGASTLTIGRLDRFGPTGPVATRCDSSTPQLCLSAASGSRRVEVMELLALEQATLAQLGVPAFTGSFHERLEGSSVVPGPTVRVFTLPQDRSAPLAGDVNLVLATVGQKACLDNGIFPPATSRRILDSVAWVQAELGDPVAARAPGTLAIRAAGVAGQEWARATLTAYSACAPAMAPSADLP